MTDRSSETRGQWTPEAMRRFWDYSRRSNAFLEDCFSRAMGGNIVRFLEIDGLMRPHMRVLDFGCGPGYLLEFMSGRGAVLAGYDPSTEAEAVARSKLESRLDWSGCLDHDRLARGEYDGTFDLITCVEVVEHVLDDDLLEVLSMIRRLLRPGGALFVSTPHEEDLEANRVYCPFCDTSFHKVQHVRSFSMEELRETLDVAGLVVEICAATDLNWFGLEAPGSILDWSGRTVALGVADACRTLVDRLRPRRIDQSARYRRFFGAGPHLIGVARSP